MTMSVAPSGVTVELTAVKVSRATGASVLYVV